MAKPKLTDLLKSAIAFQQQGLENLRTLKNIPNQLVANSIVTIGMALSPEDKNERLKNVENLAAKSLNDVLEASAITGPITHTVNTLSKKSGIQAPELYDPREFFQREDIQEVIKSGFAPTDIAVQTFVPGEVTDILGTKNAPKQVLADILRVATDPLTVFGVSRAVAGKAVLGPETYKDIIKQIAGGVTKKITDDDDKRFQGSILE